MMGKFKEVYEMKNTDHHFILPLIKKTFFNKFLIFIYSFKNWLCFGFAIAKQSQFITLDLSLRRRLLRRARRFFRQG
jgi:putative AlgH/UPF0301 family transcriptional regulator